MNCVERFFKVYFLTTQIITAQKEGVIWIRLKIATNVILQKKR